MNKRWMLRELLDRPSVARLAGARDGITARLVEQAGYDGLWASSFELSAMHGLPDLSLLSMTDYLTAAIGINVSSELPVLADCDTGFGARANVALMVHRYEAAGIAGICIEDKCFPKKNSFLSEGQVLEDAGEFAARIALAKASQQHDDFVVVARVEAFIANEGVTEVLRRAHLYADAGADAVLIHSKKDGPEEIIEFLGRWDARRPVIIVPTTYSHWSSAEAELRGIAMVIYANYTLRASVRATQETLAAISIDDAAAGVEASIASVKEIFDLVGTSEWEALDKP